MTRTSICLFACLSLIPSHVSFSAQGEKPPVEYVDPFIGTGNSVRPSVWEANGGTYPGAVAPFGLIQISPEGYKYADARIRWFSLVQHESGYPNGSAGHIYFIPFVGEGGVKNDHSSAFSHARESASPGYYQVDLPDNGVGIECAATTHAGICRLTAARPGRLSILFSDIGTASITGANRIEGHRGQYYFAIEFPSSFSADTALQETILVSFPADASRPLLMKIGVSITGVEEAKRNIAAGIPGWDFEGTRRRTREDWNDILGRITVRGGKAEERTKFYTALYHSFLCPYILSDADAAETAYGELSPWDTFRCKQPLVTLLFPSRERDMITSLLRRYKKTGWLPQEGMTGNHNIAVIADSYFKGVRGFDTALAYEAMRKSVLQPPYSIRDFSEYASLGYVPAEISYSVTKTLEYAYDDWVLAQMAGALGRTDDSVQLASRARGYRKLYNPAANFMNALSRTGEFKPGGYREGDQWTYSLFVPQDVQGLMNLMGGRSRFVEHLVHCFSDGHYVHDNEPPIHYPYLFNYAGRPDLTQHWVRRIMNESYSAGPGGLPGNDDIGAMSSWYVFSAIGLYPVCPGRPMYDLTAPLFDEVTIRLENGRILKIVADGAAKKRYVRAVSFEHRSVNTPWISHRDIAAGGTLKFELSGTVDTLWGRAGNRAVPSVTAGVPVFAFAGAELSSTSVHADEEIHASYLVTNRGKASGTSSIVLAVDNKPVQTRRVVLEPGEARWDTVRFRLYNPGIHRIAVGRLRPGTVTVLPTPANFVLGALNLPVPPVVSNKGSVAVSWTVRNTGGAAATKRLALAVDGEEGPAVELRLLPGEERNVMVPVSIPHPGVHTIGLADLPARKIRVVSDSVGSRPEDHSSVEGAQLMLSFDKGPCDIIEDGSGSGHNAIRKGEVVWEEGLFGRAIRANAATGSYVEVVDTAGTLGADPTQMTMMVWVYPMEESNFADILSRGDADVLQVRAANTEVNFYCGGYVRGEAYATVPADWNRSWHHIAGVADQHALSLYIDGKLAATKEYEGDAAVRAGWRVAGRIPWNIGRNAQQPQRIFNGRIDDVRIFARALSKEEIMAVILNE